MTRQHEETAEAVEDAPRESPIVKALCKVMEKIERRKKDDKNNHGGYDFTSVDDFKDHIRPMMAAQGLALHVTQQHFELVEYIANSKGKEEKRTVAQFDFAMTLEHTSGYSSNPEIMTVALPFTGPQTSGAARSYAVKEWMKSRFLASSGDSQDEADLIEQAREGLRLSKADARELHKELDKEMSEVIKGADHDKLGEWWIENKYRTETLPKDWFLKMRTDYVAAYKDLKAQAELDGMIASEPKQELSVTSHTHTGNGSSPEGGNPHTPPDGEESINPHNTSSFMS